MNTRRDFIKKAAMLSGAAGVAGTLPGSIQRALAIDPHPGTTFRDAEHIVILMQENRSFDHCYGTLRGVRGYNDPRAIHLPNNNLVWLQTNDKNETYAPFRLNIRDTKATWMSSLPHSWTNQVDARNNGRYDKWLQVKQSGNKDWAKMPLTLGYYNRVDIPFYYDLADAFTVCDQNFCSSLTGTTPNRLYLWTGTLRDEQKASAKPNVWNEDVDYGAEAHWPTFPERLEDNGISWKIYQNEISAAGLEGEKDGMLANFTDNPIEWFSAFNVRFATGHIQYLQRRVQQLPEEIVALTAAIVDADADKVKKLQQQLEQKKQELEKVKKDAETFTAANFAKLSPRAQNLHRKAFTTNIADPDYHELETLRYKDGDTERTVQVPKGDILHQFRTDVNNGQLPTVSWLVAPGEFSDHPGSPWYGAWYVSEVLDILTQKEEVWKKTIFILCYDENDGYFDHVPPFVAPFKPGTGLVSKGIDTGVEYVTKEQERAKGHVGEGSVRESPIGLGYRVPLVIASPWSRGGYVNSQVFDHTSILQFMEDFLQHKTGKQMKETNISAWRRTVCGDLTSVFRPFNGEKVKVPFQERNEFIEGVYNARFKKLPDEFKQLTAAEIEKINTNPAKAEWMPRQEAGTRVACALPYQLYVNGKLGADKKTFEISFAASNEVFGKKAAGSPFNVYAPGQYLQADTRKMEPVRTWSYAVTAGDQLKDAWPLSSFENEQYRLRTYGPNGFYREFAGTAQDPQLDINCEYQRSIRSRKQLTGNTDLRVTNRSAKAITVVVTDNAYGKAVVRKTIAPNTQTAIIVDNSKSHQWYDFTIKVEGNDRFEQRFAGRVETGAESTSDPAMA
ncbi:phosphocholine-specific phospholipase C [Chitinophaga qingshengii]|uniref:phospholipase C n=1 Tax=Chitinophaga qingshengii TaxID=1569794 RepID=A0ABR7TPG9_9BACT|nr:phospholipase C, phosphocholine-specific [Chitinophaga qingshengii]MBC9932372.1 phospholipase C, phosphocholine-specific [Chitinophaga qingshengii]